MAHQQSKYPLPTGLTLHRDQFFSFCVPRHWRKLHWTDQREGVIYVPDLTDLFTFLAVDVQELGMCVYPSDLDTLAENFFEAIQHMPEGCIDTHHKQVMGGQLELEAKYLFREQGRICQRWTRVFYHQTRQIMVTAQGATPEKYNFWLPCFFEIMTTTTIYNQAPNAVLRQPSASSV